MKKMNRKGFTIVELVIVIAVIAILAAVMIPTFSNVVEKANNSATLQAARNAYTNYTAEFDYTGTETIAQDLLIEVDGKWVAVKDGKMLSEVHPTKAAAAATTDADAEVLCEAHDWNAETGACNDCTEACEHDWTDNNDTECNICKNTRTVNAG